MFGDRHWVTFQGGRGRSRCRRRHLPRHGGAQHRQRHRGDRGWNHSGPAQLRRPYEPVESFRPQSRSLWVPPGASPSGRGRCATRPRRSRPMLAASRTAGSASTCSTGTTRRSAHDQPLLGRVRRRTRRLGGGPRQPPLARRLRRGPGGATPPTSGSACSRIPHAGTPRTGSPGMASRRAGCLARSAHRSRQSRFEVRARGGPRLLSRPGPRRAARSSGRRPPGHVALLGAEARALPTGRAAKRCSPASVPMRAKCPSSAGVVRVAVRCGGGGCWRRPWLLREVSPAATPSIGA